MREWLNKPVKIGLFLKIFIVLNFLFLWFCVKLAYISDLKSEEDLQYYNYLEQRVELQSELINLYREKYKSEQKY